jgi:uncharacterized protein YgbK (DUF1537 family)
MAAPGIFALADDATGALEVGAQFAQQHIDSVVSFSAEVHVFPEATAVVVDTATRHRKAAEARAVVAGWVAGARRRHLDLLYKKTDSTLRGNIGAELAAMLQAWPEAPLVYVPAYPKLDRHVRGGRLFLGELPLAESHFATDLRNPVREDHILALLHPEVPCPALSVGPEDVARRLEDGARSVLVCDSESDADLDLIADALSRHGGPYMVAGTGAFAGVWARRLRVARSHGGGALPGAPCLVINGSRHPASLEQVRRAGIAVEPLSDGPASRIAALIGATGWAVLNAPEHVVDAPEVIARQLAAVAHAVIQASGVRTLVIFGGDTARTVLDELGVREVRPLGELESGVPASLFRLANREMGLVSKAGGFGGPNALIAIRRMLEQRT